MPSRIAVLFGAGASRGAGNCIQLHRRLGASCLPHCATNSQAHGAVCRPASALAFERDFETAMLELWEQQLPDNSRLIIKMAIYFSSVPPGPRWFRPIRRAVENTHRS
jgi:hypothetical protein